MRKFKLTRGVPTGSGFKMEDSSPDLSLKLRRGSSDSRDSFYMDFAQGIDSDIEEVTTIEGPRPQDKAEGGDTDTLATPSGLDDPKELPLQ